MITMECQPGGHGGHLGHSMLMDHTNAMHQQEQDHKKKRKLFYFSPRLGLQ